MTRSIAALAALALFGCNTASSTDLKTSGLHASITGTAEGLGPTSISTTLQLGQLSTTFVALGGSDELVATSGTDTKTLSKTDILGLISYNGTVAGDDEGKSITVALNRGAEDVSAPSSVMTLPAKFQITAPVANAIFARGKDPIEVKWDVSGKPEPLTLELSGNCIEDITKTVTDNGAFVIAAVDIKGKKDRMTETCDLTLKMKRTREGTLDKAYGKGGSVRGVQLRSVALKSTP